MYTIYAAVQGHKMRPLHVGQEGANCRAQYDYVLVLVHTDNKIPHGETWKFGISFCPFSRIVTTER